MKSYHLNVTDVFGQLVIDVGPQVGVDDPHPLSELISLLTQHLVQAVKLPREIKPFYILEIVRGVIK